MSAGRDMGGSLLALQNCAAIPSAIAPTNALSFILSHVSCFMLKSPFCFYLRVFLMVMTILDKAKIIFLHAAYDFAG